MNNFLYCITIHFLFLFIILQAGLVVKTDQSIKRRQQLGLIKLNVDYQTAKKWIQERLGSQIEVSIVSVKSRSWQLYP